MDTNQAIRVLQRLADADCPEGHTGGLALVCTCEAHKAEQAIAQELSSFLLLGLALSRAQSDRTQGDPNTAE